MAAKGVARDDNACNVFDADGVVTAAAVEVERSDGGFWSDLTPGQVYELYVFGLEDEVGFVDEVEITITDANGVQTPFTQNDPRRVIRAEARLNACRSITEVELSFMRSDVEGSRRPSDSALISRLFGHLGHERETVLVQSLSQSHLEQAEA